MIVNQGSGLVHYVQEENSFSWSFDARGYLRAAVKENSKYKRGFSGRMQEIELRAAPGIKSKKARFIEGKNAERWIEKLHREAHRFCKRAGKEEKFKKLTGKYEAQKYRDNREDFKNIWGEIPILPPDQYRALVLNFTSGCSYNRCNFCNFYEDLEFDWKSPEEFREHIEVALDFFGETLSFFTEIFLGSGDLPAAGPEAVSGALKQIRKTPKLDSMPVHCFGPGFLARRYDKKQLRKLVEGGLQRIYFGLESGSRRVLDKLGKPFSPSEFRKTVHLCRKAGAAVGIIILVGAGGSEFFREHAKETVQLLNELEIGKEDRIFLSPLGEGKIGWARGRREEALDEPEKVRQAELIKEKLDYPLPVAGYVVEDFMY